GHMARQAELVRHRRLNERRRIGWHRAGMASGATELVEVQRGQAAMKGTWGGVASAASSIGAVVTASAGQRSKSVASVAAFKLAVPTLPFVAAHNHVIGAVAVAIDAEH